jgi:hypothetical protein
MEDQYISNAIVHFAELNVKWVSRLDILAPLLHHPSVD